MRPVTVISALVGDDQRDAVNRHDPRRRAVRNRSACSRLRTGRRGSCTSPEQS
jgi:hypothetical protein